MATKIRLKRIGRRNRPFYRLVVMDSRKRRDGAAIEELGWYDPLAAKENSYKIKIQRIIHWLSEGAIPTDATKKILRSSGVLHRWHLISQGMDETSIEKEMKKWELKRQEVLKSRQEISDQKKIKKAKKDSGGSIKTEESQGKGQEKPVLEEKAPPAEEEAPAEEAPAEEAPAEEAPAEEAPAEKAKKNNKKN